ncbi:hypothetical protein [Candidatus Methanomethylophilus sp. 1R26]|uniref:hypothetical protein n=1 Tax=Candidatus Methanomethylophilus sp. 1R26 TaxID=1769296 RepID=UPI000A63A322|nr:hypothetical protein [Candidatus Methanomethylophilus sp. 1R26]
MTGSAPFSSEQMDIAVLYTLMLCQISCPDESAANTPVMYASALASQSASMHPAMTCPYFYIWKAIIRHGVPCI